MRCLWQLRGLREGVQAEEVCGADGAACGERVHLRLPGRLRCEMPERLLGARRLVHLRADGSFQGNAKCTSAVALAAAFVSQLKAAKSGDKLSLICTAASPCVISRVRLVVSTKVEVTMAYVTMKDNSCLSKSCVGGLMNVHGGSVTGTRLTFSGGKALNAGGAVFIGGTQAPSTSGGPLCGSFTCVLRAVLRGFCCFCQSSRCCCC